MQFVFQVETIQRLQRSNTCDNRLSRKGRGIDIEQINIIINYDMLDSADTYLHREELVDLTPRGLHFLLCLQQLKLKEHLVQG
ncbi:hypothetical protein HN51_005033 [Arachis hypogaea]